VLVVIYTHVPLSVSQNSKFTLDLFSCGSFDMLTPTPYLNHFWRIRATPAITGGGVLRASSSSFVECTTTFAAECAQHERAVHVGDSVYGFLQ
jgi:hypothetical protein